MLLLILQFIVAYAVTRAGCQILRHLVIKTDLDDVPGPTSHSFLKGNFSKLWNADGWDFHKEIGQKYGRVARINAVCGVKQLYVSDPKALHHVIVKDQNIFEPCDADLAIHSLVFGKGLLATLGDHHRKQRKMLNPVFSIAHLRQMVPIFYEVTHKLGTTLGSKLAVGPQEMDIMHWISRAALELIAQSGLGCSLDSLTEDAVVHPYTTAVRELVPVLFKTAHLRKYLLPTLMKFGPASFRGFLVRLLPSKNIRQLCNIIDVMHNTSVEILESKRRALEEGSEIMEKQIGGGKDIISILIKANMEASEKDKMPDSEVLAQMTTLIFAAMDTTSNVLSRILSLLATHPEVQDKLRREVMNALDENDGQDFSYDQLVSLPLLDAVCRETLRLYPPLSQLLRTARKETVLPLLSPITRVDGHHIHQIVVPKDTDITISIINCNRDPELWGPDSYEWKPERWLSPLPDTILEAPVPGIFSNLLTFLGGGRACIGFKFAELEMKVVLSVLLSKFRFAPSEKEIVWEMTHISAPIEKGYPGKPKLSMKISTL